jgi:ribonuclease BN (tRNA processing enzyme)
VKLTVVGCSGSVSGPDSPASCYLVQAPYAGRTFSLVLDLGSGAFGALYRYLDPSQVDAVALSHLHPDHCLDLCSYYVAAVYSPTAPWPRRPLFGPVGTPERLSSAYEVRRSDGSAAEPGSGIANHFDFRPWRPRQQVGPFLVETAAVDHPVEAYAMRITEDVPDGGTLVYSGDTGPCDTLVGLARGADLLLVEAGSPERPDNPPGLHLTGRQAAETAQRAGVSAAVLTHIPPWSDPDRVLAEAMPHFCGPLSRAVPAASWEIG